MNAYALSAQMWTSVAPHAQVLGANGSYRTAHSDSQLDAKDDLMKDRLMVCLMALSLGAAYLIGCATARYDSPTASAQPAPPGVQQWEYSCTDGYNAQTIMERANALGRAGWEMVAGVGSERVRGLWCFKRPL